MELNSGRRHVNIVVTVWSRPSPAPGLSQCYDQLLVAYTQYAGTDIDSSHIAAPSANCTLLYTTVKTVATLALSAPRGYAPAVVLQGLSGHRPCCSVRLRHVGLRATVGLLVYLNRCGSHAPPSPEKGAWPTVQLTLSSAVRAPE